MRENKYGNLETLETFSNMETLGTLETFSNMETLETLETFSNMETLETLETWKLYHVFIEISFFHIYIK